MTRDIANWFHEHEGELFTIEETPFDRDEVVDLTNDSVDPVQQVQVDGERYIGVISYEEHDGWYEYTRYDDSAGEVNVGVCAKCVQDTEMVSDVARTLGDPTDVAREKIEQHYAEEHSEAPESVETGATLLSGTTVNGSEAIHVGMDGSNSNVDADFVRGGDAIEEGVATGGSKSDAGSVQSQFASPSNSPYGVGLDSSDCIWQADANSDCIYKINKVGNVETKFAAPCDSRGLDVDSNECIWNSSLIGLSIYKLSQSGTVQTQFSSPSDSPRGIGFDSDDCLWHADQSIGVSYIYKLTKSGTTQTKLSPPQSDPNGIDFDSNDCIWLSDSVSSCIYELTKSGTVESKFSPPSSTPTGIGLGSDDCIWNALRDSESIYELNRTNILNL